MTGEPMTERSCCDQIVDTTGRVKSLEEWRDEYIMSAQKWRDSHVEQNRADSDRISDKLDAIDSRMTTWVNPVIAVVITVLGTIVGLLAGALYAFGH